MSWFVRGPAAAALAILVACGSPPAGNEIEAGTGEGAASENAGADKPPAEAAIAGGERFVGRWSVDGNCAHFMVLGRDGSYVDYNGSRGIWRPEGEHILVFLGEQGMPVESQSLTRC